jgi:hypothetical protein
MWSSKTGGPASCQRKATTVATHAVAVTVTRRTMQLACHGAAPNLEYVPLVERAEREDDEPMNSDDKPTGRRVASTQPLSLTAVPLPPKEFAVLRTRPKLPPGHPERLDALPYSAPLWDDDQV